jgi:hypothetical protein
MLHVNNGQLRAYIAWAGKKDAKFQGGGGLAKIVDTVFDAQLFSKKYI